MNKSPSAALQHVQFIDERAVDWSNVRRVRCQFYQRFHYAYPGPIRHLKQRLMVIPADHYGTQHLYSHSISVDPAADVTRQQTDLFGNRIFDLAFSQADTPIAFEVLMLVENHAHIQNRPTVSPTMIDYLLKPTSLTKANIEIEGIARQLRDESSDPYELAQRICDWVYKAMCYQNAVTTVETTAAEALAFGKGLCQDYAHLMIAICRKAGLAARYVSGHLLGEGGSHAWVEVLLPNAAGNFRAVAFDPTNRRRPNLGYALVATGRPSHVAAGAILGAGTALVYPTLIAAISDRVSPIARPAAVGVYRFWRDMGYVAGGLLAGLLADAVGFSTSILVVAALTALSGLWVAFDMPATRGGPPGGSPRSAVSASGPAARRS